MENILTDEAVEATFVACLAESEDGAEVVEGLVSTFAFDPSALAEHKSLIGELLNGLPEQFHEGSESGGWSFLNACNDREGRQWTGLHQTMEHLFALGIGVGLAKPLLPRDFWSAMPGGMPYFVIVADQEASDDDA